MICYDCPCHKGFTHIDCRTIRPTSPQTTFPQWHYHNCIAQRWRSLIVIVIYLQLQRCLFVSRVQDEQLVTEVFPDDKHKSWYHDNSGKQLRLRSETVRDCKQVIFKMFRGWGTTSSVLNMLRGQTSTKATSRCWEGEPSRPSPQMQSMWGGDSRNPYRCHLIIIYP